jgi:hypothetical protein
MFGMRCPECGEVRWSIIARPDPETDCPACGATMLEERRHPGAAHGEPRERRDHPIAETTAAGSSSATK